MWKIKQFRSVKYNANYTRVFHKPCNYSYRLERISKDLNALKSELKEGTLVNHGTDQVCWFCNEPIPKHIIGLIRLHDINLNLSPRGGMVDTEDLKSSGRKAV